MDFKPYVREVPDFPVEGSTHHDLTQLFADAKAFKGAIEAMAEPVRVLQPTHVLGLEARGFIFGSALAQRLGLGFVPARKPGLLPPPTYQEPFLSGQEMDALEIHEDAFRPGDRVLLVDDLLATGSTAAAARRLVERTGAHPLALTLFLEIERDHGRVDLKDLPVFSLLRA
jgi:adenine phosphoribosyltransferase